VILPVVLGGDDGAAQVVLTDDIDGPEAEETVRFGLDRAEYEIDLGKEHASQPPATFAPYIRRRPARR
jgi:Lsr2